MGYIYLIENEINKKIYIGQTTKTIEERWAAHINIAKIRKNPLYKDILLYGKENFSIKTIENVSNDDLDERECYYIKFYNTLYPNGYNMMLGGRKFNKDNPMYHNTSKIILSNRVKGDNNPSKREDVKEKIRNSRIGKKASDETKKKMSENNGRYWLNKKLSEETKKKISEHHFCKGKFGILNPNHVCVNQIDVKTNKVICTYGSIADAAKEISKQLGKKVNASNISQAYKGYQKTAFGYKWEKAKV